MNGTEAPHLLFLVITRTPDHGLLITAGMYLTECPTYSHISYLVNCLLNFPLNWQTKLAHI